MNSKSSDDDSESRIVCDTSDSFDNYNRCFNRLKKDHTCVGMWIDVSTSNCDKYKVHSVWIK